MWLWRINVIVRRSCPTASNFRSSPVLRMASVFLLTLSLQSKPVSRARRYKPKLMRCSNSNSSVAVCARVPTDCLHQSYWAACQHGAFCAWAIAIGPDAEDAIMCLWWFLCQQLGSNSSGDPAANEKTKPQRGQVPGQVHAEPKIKTRLPCSVFAHPAAWPWCLQRLKWESYEFKSGQSQGKVLWFLCFINISPSGERKPRWNLQPLARSPGPTGARAACGWKAALKASSPSPIPQWPGPLPHVGCCPGAISGSGLGSGKIPHFCQNEDYQMIFSSGVSVYKDCKC